MKTVVFIVVWTLCCFNAASPSFKKAARINEVKSDKVKRTPLGEETTLKCFYEGQPPPQVTWTKGKMMLGEKCALCVQKVEHQPGLSTLRVTPFRDADFGDYKCTAKNKLGFKHIMIKLREDNSKNITQCQKDRVLSRDPRLKLEFLPRCNADGSYHMIQCSVHLSKCWCVDQAGHKTVDAVDGNKGMHCSKPKDMTVISIAVLAIAIILSLLLIDLVCHVTRNKGVINKLVGHRNGGTKDGKLKPKDEATSKEAQDKNGSKDKATSKETHDKKGSKDKATSKETQDKKGSKDEATSKETQDKKGSTEKKR